MTIKQVFFTLSLLVLTFITQACNQPAAETKAEVAKAAPAKEAPEYFMPRPVNHGEGNPS